MTKTTIAALQEYAARQPYGMPIYSYIGDQMIGQNDHQFTIRVKYKSLSVDGKGSTKQSAKHKAAQEMLTLLGCNPSANYETQLLSNSLNKTHIIESTQKEINYIGLLHELCAKKRLKLPTFSEACSSGPHHQMNFIIKCKVEDIEQLGDGRTKKQARLEAAKKVWHLCKDKFNLYDNEKLENSEFGLNVEEINLEDILPDYKGENKIAIDKYLKLTKLTVTPLLAENINIENCHRVFTSEHHSTINRKRILQLLSTMSTGTENPSFVEKYFNVIQQIATILNAELKPINLDLNHLAKIENGNVNYAVGYKLYTAPTITGIGDGTTMAIARLKAIFNIKNSLTLLFC